ncbi:MAG TPA: class I SAM-dependent methyltransferase [Gemmataceae bacterium]|nr:class I SAM-dependent methyltransferase [Gemmataceae bacterium]
MGKWLSNPLDNPLVWRTSRWLFDLTLGLYRRRFRLLRRWGVLEGDPSVLDIGCGVGPYARVTRGPYLGIDLNERYIRCAARLYRGTNCRFRRADVTTLSREHKTYNLALLVDFLHHLPDNAAVTILREAWRLADGQVICFEPVRQQTNVVGRWLIAHDRGDFMRPLEELHGLFERAGLPIGESRELYLGLLRTRAILCRKGAAARLPRRTRVLQEAGCS